jgi:microcystin-dependent protein
MPFDIDVTTPQDNMLISAYPANARASRQTIQDIITAEHYEGDGTHKVKIGTTAARPVAPQVGNLYYDTTLQVLLICLTAGNWTQVGSAGVSAGTIKAIAYLYASLEAGWLPCDGRAIDRTTYAILYSKIGVKYGAGDGTTTFNIPNMSYAVPAGLGAVLGVPTADGDGEYGDVGLTYGAKKKVLTTGTLPAHTHGPSGDHAHTIQDSSGGGGFLQKIDPNASDGSVPEAAKTTAAAGDHTHASVGTGDPFDVRQKEVVFGWAIYTGV